MYKRKRANRSSVQKRATLLHSMSANKNNNSDPIPRDMLSPQQIAVALGILSNALTIDSVLLDRNQIVQVVVSGSLAELKDFLGELDLTPADLMKMF